MIVRNLMDVNRQKLPDTVQQLGFAGQDIHPKASQNLSIQGGFSRDIAPAPFRILLSIAAPDAQ